MVSPLPTAHPAAPKPSRTPAVSPLTRSRILTLAIPAPQDGLPTAPAYVYLPKGYSPSGPAWPLLLLIGAAPGSTDDWLHPGHIDQVLDRMIGSRALSPFVVVMPTTNPSVRQDNECLDTLHGPRVETYLLRVLLPTLQRRLNISRDRQAHAVAGFSAGADCALNIGLRHLTVFSAIAALDAEGAPGALADQSLLDNRPSLVRANSPRLYIPSMTIPARFVVYLNAGGGADVGHSDLLQRELRARGVTVRRHDQIGTGHTWADVHADASSLLSFIGDQITTR